MTAYEVVRRPSPRSTAISGVAGSFAVLASTAGGGLAAAVALAGVVVVLAGVTTARHQVVDGGALAAFVGIVVAALSDASALPVVMGTAATVVAWDAGGNAISLGKQVGRGADTARVEALHALFGASVGVAGGVVGFVLFRAGPTHQPVTTLFVLLLAAAVLTVALNR